MITVGLNQNLGRKISRKDATWKKSTAGIQSMQTRRALTPIRRWQRFPGWEAYVLLQAARFRRWYWKDGHYITPNPKHLHLELGTKLFALYIAYLMTTPLTLNSYTVEC